MCQYKSDTSAGSHGMLRAFYWQWNSWVGGTLWISSSTLVRFMLALPTKLPCVCVAPSRGIVTNEWGLLDAEDQEPARLYRPTIELMGPGEN